MTTTAQHTAASLAAIYDRNPRELDAIAYEFVMGERLIDWAKVDDALVVYPNRIDYKNVPHYSTSLDAAALLEKALSARGLKFQYADKLQDQVDKQVNESLLEDDCDGGMMINYTVLFDIASATAAQRTIAAVLAAQEEAKG